MGIAPMANAKCQMPNAKIDTAVAVIVFGISHLAFGI
jgi:hypothetical protein